MNSVDPTVTYRDDQYYEELLGAAAFGTLNAAEVVELRAFLATSESARAELAELRVIAGELSLLADEMEPSADLRGRIEQAVLADVAWALPATEVRPTSTTPPPGPAGEFVSLSTEPRVDEIADHAAARKPIPLWGSYLWAAAAALVIAVLAGVVLDRFVLDGGGDTADNRETIAFDLSLATPVPDLGAELTYDPEQRLFVLETENMPAAPEGQVYQIWLIDKNAVPRPKGVMDDSTFVVAANRDDYTAFAITVEPGPIGSEGPTTTPFFVAPLTPEAGT